MEDASSTVAHQGSTENGGTTGQTVVEDRGASVARVSDSDGMEGHDQVAVEGEDLAGPREVQTQEWLTQTLASLPRYRAPVGNPTEQPDMLLRELERMF